MLGRKNVTPVASSGISHKIVQKKKSRRKRCNASNAKGLDTIRLSAQLRLKKGDTQTEGGKRSLVGEEDVVAVEVEIGLELVM